MATVKLNSLVIFASLFAAVFAVAAPQGSYKMTDAFCTNSAYVFSEDEMNYIRSVRGEGSCKSGRYTDFPCYEDYYTFGPGAAAKLVTKTSDLRGLACVLTTPATFSESDGVFLNIFLGKAESRSQGETEDSSISCSVTNEDDPDSSHLKIKYRTHGDKLHFIQGSDKECGEFIIELTPVEKTP